MDNKIKILKLLINNKESRFTINKIAESLKMNYRTAYENTLQLEKESLIKITKAGNSKLCEFTYKFNNKVFEAEYERRNGLFKNLDFAVIHDRFALLEFPFIVLLFGSQASRKATKYSDFDILTIGGDKEKIERVVNSLPDKVHLTAITYGDFMQMARSKQFTVVSEALKNNIILIGIEEYYRLLENVR